MQLLSKKPLKVVANPFAAPLDRHGRPAAAVQYDPEHIGPGQVIYIGAARTQELIRARPEIGATWKPTGNQGAKYDVRFMFDLEPLEVVDSQYHRDRILGGELLAADPATAKRVGLKAFEEPSVLLEEAKTAAVEAWKAQHDELPDVEAWHFAGTKEEPVTPQLAGWPRLQNATAPAAPAASHPAPEALPAQAGFPKARNDKAPKGGAGGDAL
ncbi:MAG: hypothetical protein WKG00_03280 [Polyangiaceae bacterium]